MDEQEQAEIEAMRESILKLPLEQRTEIVANINAKFERFSRVSRAKYINLESNSIYEVRQYECESLAEANQIREDIIDGYETSLMSFDPKLKVCIIKLFHY